MKRKVLYLILMVMLVGGQFTALPVQAKGEQLYLPVTMQNGASGAINEQSLVRQWVLSAEVSHGAFGSLEVFKGYLYAGTSNYSVAPYIGSQIYRTKDGVDWQAVTPPAFGRPFPEPGSLYIDYIWDMIVFQGQLYAGYGRTWCDFTWNCVSGVGQIWRTADGVSWEAIVADGFGDPLTEGVVQFAIFNDVLYAGTLSYTIGFQVWRSVDGENWTQVATASLGSPDSLNPTGMIVFKGQLYLVAEGGYAVTRVWRTADGLDWQSITQDGFSDPNNISPGGFAIYKNFLYLGMANYTTGGQLWRSKDGLDWEPVVQDGFGAGAENEKIEGIYVYDGHLYAHTINWMAGTGIFRLMDDDSWLQVNAPGFGNPYNGVAAHWSNGVTAFKGDLYYGGYDTRWLDPAAAAQVWRWCGNCP